MKIIPHSKPIIGQEEKFSIAKVIESGQITQERKVVQFEQKMARYIGRKYAIAVSSGLAALHLALVALNYKKGYEIIVPSYTCDALLNTVLYLGAKPKIVDVGYETGTKRENILKQTKIMLGKKFNTTTASKNFLGNGRAAEKMMSILSRKLKWRIKLINHLFQ